MKEPKGTHANEIVSSVKSYKQFFEDKFLTLDVIDFLGCSENYVEEKINALIDTLQYTKKMMRSIEKTQKILEKERRPIKD